MGNSQNLESSNVQCVIDLIDRILPSLKDQFILKKFPNKNQIFFGISSIGNKILIEGNDNVSLSYGFNFYLCNFLHFSISWCGNHISEPPTPLPLPSKPIQKICKFPYRYYLNNCTHSYSMAFWDWER